MRVSVLSNDSSQDYSRCCVKKDQAGDIDVEVPVVESPIFTQGVADDEDQARPWENSRDFPALVMSMQDVAILEGELGPTYKHW